MDDLLSRTTIGSGYYLLPSQLDDPAKKMGVTRDMIIAAAARMSERSHLFSIIISDAKIPATATLFQVRGSITSNDQNVAGTETGGGISVASAVAATLKNRSNVSNMAVSLYFVDRDERIIDGTFHSAQLQLINKSKSGLLNSFLQFLGGSITLDSSASDGPQAGAKALIDLAMIQAVGVLTQVPYTTCLAKMSVNPATTTATWDAYRRMKPAQQQVAIVREMVERNLAPPNPSPEKLRQAILSFERSQGMTPAGIVRFELYDALQQSAASPEVVSRRNGRGPAVKVAPSGSAFTYPQTTTFNAGEGYPSVVAGDKLAFEVTVAEPAYVACFYTDGQKRVSRVFPTDRHPSYRLEGGERLRIPGDQDGFVVRPERGNTGEWMTCLADKTDFLARISNMIPNISLAPLSGISSAQQLIDNARKADPDLSTDTLTYLVK